MVSFKKPDPVELRASWKAILHVGIPAAGTNAIIPLGAVFITAMIARYGPEAVAGFGVATRIESMMLVMFYALSSVIGPFVGQNLATGNPQRILRALRLCSIFCLASGLMIAVFLAVMSGVLPTLFSDSENVMHVTSLFLWIVPISYGAYGVVMVINASFNGLGSPMPAVYISVIRITILYLPLALFALQFFGVAGIFAAYAVANIVSSVLAYRWAIATVKHKCEAVLPA